MLRAGPFSDERVIRLANRRFVPFYFDLSDRGFAADADARAFVVRKKKAYGGRSVPTPDVLLMTPDGELVGSVSNYAGSEQVLKTLLDALSEHPEFDKPAAGEGGDSVIERAEVLIDLQRLEAARKALADAEGAKAAYLRGRIARFANDFATMRKHFATVRKHLAKVDTEDLADDVRVEAAYEHWHGRAWAKLREALADFPKDSSRYTEARYYEGLAHYHEGDVEAARAIWKATIESCAQDPWVYRADWAYCNAKPSKKRGPVVFSSRRKGESLLGRIGYMGRRNPDLDGPVLKRAEPDRR